MVLFWLFTPWALYWSCITGSLRIATLSIAAGSPVDQLCDLRLARASATHQALDDGFRKEWLDQMSPLELACKRNQMTCREQRAAVVKLLLAHGGGQGPRTALALVELCQDDNDPGDVQFIRLLLETGNAFVKTELDGGETALHRACYNESVTYVNMMLEAGADVHAKDKSGQLPIDFAVSICEYTDLSPHTIAISRLLLAYGSTLGQVKLEAIHFELMPELRNFVEKED